MNVVILILSALIVCPSGLRGKQLLQLLDYTKTPYQWNQLEFSFPNDRARKDAEHSGNLKPTNAIPIDLQPHYFNKHRLRTFVTIPRFQNGIPYSLATVSHEKGPNGPWLKPYPTYEAHSNNNGKGCDVITSAFRAAINECNQMWVIDSGTVGLDAQCPPQLLLFDLNTDRLVHRFRFPPSVYKAGASLFITPLVDVRNPPPTGDCSHTMVYVADVNYHGLVVYDFKQNSAWRIENMFMYPDPNYGLHSLAGEKFVLMDGIFGMATDKKNLYFHPLASATEYAVPLRVINNSTLFASNQENMHETFMALGKRSSECGASAMDSNSNLYCVTFNPIELTAWNVNTPYNSNNIKRLPIQPAELEFVSGMKVVRNHQGNEELWMLSNRFQKMAAGTQNFNEVNFRIVVLPLGDIIPMTPKQDLHNQLIFKD